MRKFARWKMVGVGLAASLMMVGCSTADETGTSGSGGGGGEEGGSGGGAEASQQINAAGASFPAPLYTAMFQQFAGEEDGIQVNYQSIGSSGGREQFISETVAFGASDAPMSEEEEESAGGNPVHIATVGGAVVPAYNLEGVEDLNFSGELLAEIFLGNVTNWSDPAIAELNPDAELPDEEITVVHRSDGSGTTSIFTEYLAAVSPAWEEGPGAGDELAWPTGVGGDGNEGVAGQVQQIDASLGYVGLEYAVANDITYGNVGSDGEFVEPSVETAQAALDATADEIPEDLKITPSSLNPTGEGVYPITGLTWLLVRQEMDDLAQCKAVAETAWYATHEGQELAPEQNYVPVSEDIIATDEEFIEGMMAEGEPCYEG